MKTISSLIVLMVGISAVVLQAAPATPIELWPAGAPGEKEGLGEEKDLSKPADGLVAGKPLIRLGNVAKPTLTLYRPAAGAEAGPAVMVCPGGGYHILAMDLEGTEVCEWLNSIGVTAALLKYRVPKRPGVEKHAPALQDAQRAFSLLRHRARDLGLDPQRLGVIGFSAGAHLSAALSTSATRTYPTVDSADEADWRPNFTALIYPAYLTVKEQGDKVAPELPLTTNTPPTFLAITEDDPVRMENAVHYALALKQTGVPVELHLYPSGGHGYGLRRTENPVTFWPDRVTDWMRAGGWLREKSGRRQP